MKGPKMGRLEVGLIALVSLMSACAAPGQSNSTAGSPPTIPAQGDAPSVNWDHPLAWGQTTTLTAVRTSPAALGLSFTPRIPAIKQPLKTVDVTDPSKEPPQGRGVAFIYDFSGDPRFPGDARVYIDEEPVRGTEAELEAIVANPPGNPQDFSLQHYGSLTILLIQNHGVGSAEFLQDGVDYTVTGPDTPPQVALDLAEQLGTQIS